MIHHASPILTSALGSARQANTVVATPFSLVGSIGAAALHSGGRQLGSATGVLTATPNFSKVLKRRHPSQSVGLHDVRNMFEKLI